MRNICLTDLVYIFRAISFDSVRARNIFLEILGKLVEENVPIDLI
jgi:hypothetical protein